MPEIVFHHWAQGFPELWRLVVMTILVGVCFRLEIEFQRLGVCLLQWLGHHRWKHSACYLGVVGAADLEEAVDSLMIALVVCLCLVLENLWLLGWLLFIEGVLIEISFFGE